VAIFRPGPLAGAVSGALGNVVFAQGSQMPVVRPRPNPIRPATPLQISQHRAYAQCCIAWRALSTASRLSWELGARNIQTTDRLGRQRSYRPFALFMKTNLPRAAQGFYLLETFVHYTYQPPRNTFVLDFRFGGPYLVSDMVSTYWWLAFADVRAGRTFRTSAQAFYRPAPLLRNADLISPDTNIYSAFCGRLGPPQCGEYVYASLALPIFSPPLPPFATVVSQVPTEGLNLIQNPDFDTSWTPPLAPGWLRSGTQSMTWDTVTPWCPPAHCYVVFPALAGWNYLRTRISPGIQNGKRYRIRLAMNVTGPSPVYPSVYAPPSAYTVLGSVPADGNWYRKNWTYTATASSADAWLMLNVDYNTSTAFHMDVIDVRYSP
jgi:hypothetical protein